MTWKWYETHNPLMGLFMPHVNIIHEMVEPQSGYGKQDGRTDGWMDRQADGVRPIYPPPPNFVVHGV